MTSDDVTTSPMGSEEHHHTAEETNRLHTWRLFGSRGAEWIQKNLIHKTERYSPMLSNALTDGEYIRCSFGNLWFAFPVIGAILGALSLSHTGGVVVPPSTVLFLAIVVLGIFDAFSGLVATAIFSVGALVTGHINGLRPLATLVLIGVLWFGGAQLVHRLRPTHTGHEGEATSHKWWRMLGDFVILPVLAGFILSKLAFVMPYVSGLKVPIASKETLINIVASLAMLLRAIGMSAVLNLYHDRMRTLAVPPTEERGKVGALVSLAIQAFLAYVLIWTFLGNRWQTFAILGIYLAFQPIVWVGQSFPEVTFIYRLVPRNLLKLVVIILVAEALVKALSSKFADPVQLMGWTFIVLGVFVLLLLVFEQFRGKAWPSNWLTRIIGAVVVIGFLAVAQGWVKIA